MIFYLKRYYRIILAYIFVLTLSLMPADELNKPSNLDIPHLDKVAHFGMYFILTAALILDISKYWDIYAKKTFIIAGVISFITGGGVELIQKYLLSDRTGDIFDMLANIAGILISFTFFMFAPKVEVFRRIL